MSLGRIAGCLAQSLSIRIPVCVCSLLGHSQLGMAVGGKLLCCGYVFLGSHKLGNSFKPDALGGFGWYVSTQHNTACWPCLVCLPRVLLLPLSPKCGCCLGVRAAAPVKGDTNRLGQMAGQVVFIPAGQTLAAKSRLCFSLHG